MNENLGSVTALDPGSVTRYFFDLSPHPLLVVEGATHIVRHLNTAFSNLVGKEAAEIIGCPFAEAVPGANGNSVKAFDRVYRTGTPEILAEDKNPLKSLVHWSYSIWAILGGDLRPTGLVVQISDTSEMAIFRSQAISMNEQLLLSSTRQHELTEEAQRANQIKDEFLAILSHELRTPLTSILGWAGMLGSAKMDAATTLHAISVINRNARMQVQMIDDLLDHARIITGKLRLTRGPLDLGAIILAAVDVLRPAADAKGISVQLQFASPTGLVSGDGDRLQQVVWNLISNAIKFTPKGGRVVVGLKRVGTELQGTVKDTGVGIAKEFLPHVFDRFRQADATSTRAFGGLGLGLAIVRQLIELHGGTVKAFSDGKGLGSTFTYTLPAIEGVLADQTGGDAQAGGPLTPVQCPPELSGARILIVEDEADTCELLKIILEACSAQVKTAASTEEAMEAIERETFDVLISDIGLPNEDGYALIARIRALPPERGGAIPAAALTAYAGNDDRNRVLEAGFQVHVAKPISQQGLLSIVAKLARHEF